MNLLSRSPLPAMSYMEHCISLARRSLGISSPNPAVGAVVVRDGEVVGEGNTRPPGQSHAEIVALDQAGAAARGSEIYVTLEPCCFAGRTPACTAAIIERGVSRVHVAAVDPNPRVSGKGVRELERAGIDVVLGESRRSAERVVEGYSKYITTGRPFVTAKFAASLDGKIATRSGESQWITGPEARDRAHEIRRSVDAILVGSGTVNTDNPRLTARDPNGHPLDRQPARIVIAGKSSISPDALIFNQPGRAFLATPEISPDLRSRLEGKGVEVLIVPQAGPGVDLNALLDLLGKKEMTNVLVEGGGALLGSFFDNRLVEKVVAFLAPVIIGGDNSLGAIGGNGVEAMAGVLRLTNVDIETLGPDIVVTGYA